MTYDIHINDFGDHVLDLIKLAPWKKMMCSTKTCCDKSNTYYCRNDKSFCRYLHAVPSAMIISWALLHLKSPSGRDVISFALWFNNLYLSKIQQQLCAFAGASSTLGYHLVALVSVL